MSLLARGISQMKYTGSLGDDDLTGGNLNDIIYGGEGRDDFYPSGGNDSFFGVKVTTVLGLRNTRQESLLTKRLV